MSLSLLGLKYTVGTITWALLTMSRNCFIETESLCFMNQEGKELLCVVQVGRQTARPALCRTLVQLTMTFLCNLTQPLGLLEQWERILPLTYIRRFEKAKYNGEACSPFPEILWLGGVKTKFSVNNDDDGKNYRPEIEAKGSGWHFTCLWQYLPWALIWAFMEAGWEKRPNFPEQDQLRSIFNWGNSSIESLINNLGEFNKHNWVNYCSNSKTRRLI